MDSCNVGASATLINLQPFDGRPFAVEDAAYAINAYYVGGVSSLWASSGGIYNLAGILRGKKRYRSKSVVVTQISNKKSHLDLKPGPDMVADYVD